MNLQNIALAVALLTCGNLFAQSVDFGRDQQPSDTEAIDDLIYYGGEMEFIGGYFEGDTVGDFTVYGFTGQRLNLYETLANGKPTLMMSASVSCPRATDGFLPEATSSNLYGSLQQLLNTHYDDFNWIMVYGVEAHPTVGECPSNCPPGFYNDTTVAQHETYLYRRYAVGNLQNSPQHDFPFTIYADNPDNAVYNNFFQRPFGLCAINCNGVVELRGDWAHSAIHQNYDALVAMINEAPCTENPDGEVTTVGEATARIDIKAWPNPALESVRISIPARFGNTVRIRLIDSVGRVVRDEPSAAGEQTIPLQNIAKGVFFIEISGDVPSERIRLVHQ